MAVSPYIACGLSISNIPEFTNVYSSIREIFDMVGIYTCTNLAGRVKMQRKKSELNAYSSDSVLSTVERKSTCWALCKLKRSTPLPIFMKSGDGR